MPIIHVNMYEGRTIELKWKLVTAITDAVRSKAQRGLRLARTGSFPVGQGDSTTAN
jgi:hypothetical protein